MKKIIILLLALTSSNAFCALKFNQRTKRYYSEPASSKVDQNEYHNLACDLERVIRPKSFFELTAVELAVLFAQLKAIGTPTALQLMHDIEQGIKERNKEIKRIQRL